METNLAILALTAMKIMLTGGISDEIQKGVLEKAADMSIDMAEEQLENTKKVLILIPRWINVMCHMRNEIK